MKAIFQSDGYLSQIGFLVEPQDALRKHGFIVQPLDNDELLLKRRCLGCGKAMSQVKGRERAGPGHTSLPPAANNVGVGSISSDSAGVIQLPAREPGSTTVKAAPAPQFKCKFHPGQLDGKEWDCCKQHVRSEPCGGAYFHNPREESLINLARQYQFVYTPIEHVSRFDIRPVVALDCEMGTAESGDTALIKVTLIDYFTSEVLVNNIVEPDVQMRHLNTRYSGVTWGHMRAAQRNRTILTGTPGARQALWKYMGWETIIVGHGLSNDLRALKLIHTNVVDSHIIESNIKQRREEKERKAKEEAIVQAKADGTYVEEEKVPSTEVASTPAGENAAGVPGQRRTRRQGGPRGGLALKTLVERRLGRKIQQGEGSTGHDSLEDAIAARDLIHWHIMNPGVEN